MNALRLIVSQGRYFAPAFVFASLNIVFGTWAIYIPAIKSHLQINEGELGTAIFFMALGTLLLISLAPRLINRLGVGRATGFGIVCFLFSFILPFSADQYIWFCTGMFLVGACAGFTDVAMNTLVSEIEKRDNIHIMSANHGFFSLGGFLGAGIGGFFLTKEVLPIQHLMVVIAVLLLVNLVFIGKYFNVSSEKLAPQTINIKLIRPILLIGIIAFFIMATEGAIVDWSALYLEKISEAKLSWLGLGYTIFSATMAIGRFMGDAISSRFGSKRLILIGVFIAIIGFCAILLVGPIIVLIGFGLVGIGLSIVIPEIIRLAGKAEHIDAALAISLVSGIGFMGFLVGPVLLGFLAELSSLKLSFVALLAFVVMSFLAALTLKNK
ncbi:fucose permease [Flavobacteriaceae bacterium MAR_2010_105]|nr:fucose permease [Flavobacteriaceae bacterium MAR_2010_105]